MDPEEERLLTEEYCRLRGTSVPSGDTPQPEIPTFWKGTTHQTELLRKLRGDYRVLKLQKSASQLMIEADDLEVSSDRFKVCPKSLLCDLPSR